MKPLLMPRMTLINEVTVYFNPQENSKAIQTYEKFCCTPSTYYNRENKETIRSDTTTIEETKGLEYCDSKAWTWSTSGGLSATYHRAGASLTIGYTKSQSQSLKRNEVSVVREVINHNVRIPRKSSVTVEVKQ